MKSAHPPTTRRLRISSKSILPFAIAAVAAVTTWAILRSALGPAGFTEERSVDSIAAIAPELPKTEPPPRPAVEESAQPEMRMVPWDWPDRVSEVFAKEHGDWLARLAKSSPELRAAVVPKFQRLAANPTGMRMIEAQPELAFPLALAISARQARYGIG